MNPRKRLSYPCEEQRIRLANLLAILRELGDFGTSGLREKAQILDSDVEALRSVLLGEAMTEAHARNLEHAADRPRYWMDTDHEARPSVEAPRVQHPPR
jgi:hypothetical protein